MNYFDKFESIIIKLETAEEIDSIVNDLKNGIESNLNTSDSFTNGLNYTLHEDGIPYIRYTFRKNMFTRGTMGGLETGECTIPVRQGRIEYEKVFTIKNHQLFKTIIKSGGEQFKVIPEYKPRTFKY